MSMEPTDTEQAAERGQALVLAPGPVPSPASPSRSPFASASTLTVSLAALACGGMLTGLAITGVLAPKMAPAGFAIDEVPTAEQAAAEQSLGPVGVQRITQVQRQCPLAMASVVVRGTDAASGVVRIRSGAYVTPPIRLDTVPVRVALPYPAPYPTGAGQLILEGDGAALDMFLTPGWTTTALRGTAVLNVHWTPRHPC